ncbi:MAG: hypothetical protein AAFO76_02635 [Cyanobacteria bacterium J06607_15]
MKFPLRQYLRQLFLDRTYIVSPLKYWRIYRVEYLEHCWNNSFLEYCWLCDYDRFVEQHWDWIDRYYWDEGDRGYVDLYEYCWQLNYYRFCCSGDWQEDYEEK